METCSALLVICAGSLPVLADFPTQRPVTRSFDVLFDLRPNKRLSKQSWGWWFEMSSRPLWRHRNVLVKGSPGILTTSCTTYNGIINTESILQDWGMSMLVLSHCYHTQLLYVISCNANTENWLRIFKLYYRAIQMYFRNALLSKAKSRNALTFFRYRPSQVNIL